MYQANIQKIDIGMVIVNKIYTLPNKKLRNLSGVLQLVFHNSSSFFFWLGLFDFLKSAQNDYFLSLFIAASRSASIFLSVSELGSAPCLAAILAVAGIKVL